MAIYVTDDDSPWGPDIPVTTQSMIKAFKSCPREVYYKFVLRLQPKILSKPLTRGKWFHALLEAYYKGEDWQAEHKQWVSKFNKLFDEEKEALGSDLPRDIERMMKSYLWHYGDPRFTAYGWKVHEVEFTIETPLPNGHLFRGRVDMLIEDDFGLWAVDHKTHKKLPDWEFRMLDEQSPLYVWALHQMGIPVTGFIWNYIKTESISVPRVVKDGSRFYAKMGDSDYPTYAAAVKAAQADYPNFLADAEDKDVVRQELKRLKAQRWVPGVMPTSPHFRRDILERDPAMVERVLTSAVRTSDRMHAYDFSEPDAIERNVGTCAKGFLCNYRSLSLVDLVKGESQMVQKREYQKGDPLKYYGEEERLG